MSNKVLISVVVDTDKLVSEFPKGGKVENRGLIVMSDNQPDSSYTDSHGGLYKDKLHTMVDWDDDMIWTISALNGKDKLVFSKCDGPTLTDLLTGMPQADASDKAKWNAKVKNKLTAKYKPWYTFYFHLKNDDTNIWFWDPSEENRIP